MNLFCYLDFEFYGTAERELNLVSVVAKCYRNGHLDRSRTFWLHQDTKAKAEARAFFKDCLLEGYVFVAYAAEAEARALSSLFKNPKWYQHGEFIDLYLEYRCLLNRNHAYAYGHQLIDGRVINTSPPPNKWESPDDGDDAHHRPSYSLAAACFKLLSEFVDFDRKTAVRELIIRGVPEEIEEARAEIETYNQDDITHLTALHTWFHNHYLESGIPPETWLKYALKRGDYAMRTARMVELGYPVSLKKLKHFTKNVRGILSAAAEEALALGRKEEVLPFRYAKADGRQLVMNTGQVRVWAEKQNKPYWRKTEGGRISISKDAFRDWYSSDSPGFAGAFCRYLKTKQSLNGFLPGGKRGKFTDYLGSDGRVRPYFGIYGAQSSRSQPAATGFIPLKAHWMRNFLDAGPGRALAGVDYASQEFLIAAILSQDDAMMAAYQSGDVYTAFAKEAKLMPPTGTKASHPQIRDACKALVLGISYDMTAKGMAPRITVASGEPCSEDRAQDLIDTFFSIYSDYAEWKTEILEEYKEGYLELPDGWIMWGDNDNPRSVGNFPIQGHGAVIMREAVRRAQDAGLDVIYTLHDAVYVEYQSFQVEAIRVLKRCMSEAFEAIMAPYGKITPIRLEGDSWSQDYAAQQPKSVPDVVFMAEYSDSKGKADLERYRKFFEEDSQLKTKEELPWPSSASAIPSSIQI